MPGTNPIREERLRYLKEVVEREEVESQQALVRRLEGAGFAVTQSSISRDLRDLGIVKERGAYRLRPMAGARDGVSPPDHLREIALLLRGVAPAGAHLLVLETLAGGASRLAYALDRDGGTEIVGTVAGDDTVFVAFASVRHRRRVEARLRALMEGEPDG